MAIYKRGKTCHVDVAVSGIRYGEPLGTDFGRWIAGKGPLFPRSRFNTLHRRFRCP
jgi:hypothetical protein